jgi:hypothetical protein
VQGKQEEKERASYVRSLNRRLLLYRKDLAKEELERSIIASTFTGGEFCSNLGAHFGNCPY